MRTGLCAPPSRAAGKGILGANDSAAKDLKTEEKRTKVQPETKRLQVQESLLKSRAQIQHLHMAIQP
jgi:hypothetical protein